MRTCLVLFDFIVEPNGDRWKAPNIEIVCCKQCHGYGIADEFVEKNYCSDKCRKNSTTRSSLTKSLNNVAKIQVKEKLKFSVVQGMKRIRDVESMYI